MPPLHLQEMANAFPFNCITAKEGDDHTILDCDCYPEAVNLDPIPVKNPDNLKPCKPKVGAARPTAIIDGTDEAKTQDIIIDDGKDDTDTDDPTPSP